MSNFRFGQQTVNQSNGRDTEEVGAYINLGLGRADGSNFKVDRGLRLYFSDENQRALAEMLQTPEGVEKFKQALVVNCNIIGDKPKASLAVLG